MPTNNTFLLSALLVISSATSLAQNSKKIFKVKPGETVINTIPKQEIYTYPQFTNGTVVFRNETIGGANMNYNSLIGEMEFINEKGDTLSLDNAITIKFIAIGMDTFFYDKGYIKQIANNNNIKLAYKKLISQSNRQKLGGFGEVSSGSIDTYNSVNLNSNNLKQLVAKEILSFTEYITFYFGDKFNHYVPATKKNLFNLSSKYQDILEKYLKENDVNFTKEEDLKKLVDFLGKL